MKTSRRNGWFSHAARSDAAAVVDQRFEDLEPGPPRRAQAAAEHAAGDRRGLARLQRRDRLKAAAIFVAERKAVEEIFDGDEAGVLEIGGAAGTDAFQELQGRRQGVSLVRRVIAR